MPPKKQWTIEDLRLQENTIKEVFDWWSHEMNTRGEKLQKLLESDESNYQEVEKLQEEIESLQKRGQIEQKILDNFEKEKQAYLMNSLVSGALNIKWNNE